VIQTAYCIGCSVGTSLYRASSRTDPGAMLCHANLAPCSWLVGSVLLIRRDLETNAVALSARKS
jgi:hypothetical protein